MAGSFRVVDVKTAPIDGQKTGTSGLRKKVAEFKKPNYLANWVQSLFSSVDGLKGSSIALGGDGRYWNKDAVRIICRIAAANGVAKVLVGQNGILCTPALSAIVRRRELLGGIILTASHNPGGPNADFGIKYNVSNGGPAPESVTDKILTNTKTITTYGMACVDGADAGTEADPFASVDLSVVGASEFKSTDGAAFTIDVVDSAADYVELLQSMFDFEALKALFARSDFSFLFDAMSGVTGPYAKRIFVELLGGPADCVMRGEPLEDFGGAHPDPNLTYAADLVASCDPKKSANAPAMGAASDGDGDRNMILGRGFFVTPSDSLAVIAAKAKAAIPFFKDGLTGVARSMPTASAVDHVATKMGISCFETPTGWKFFGNLLDAGKAQICGEESFGTGAFHVREKDGIFAVLCWLAVLAHENASTKEGELISIESIVTDHWKVYGRNFFSRYDYEEVDSEAGAKLMATVTKVQEEMTAAADSTGAMTLGDFPVKVTTADNFSYTDPIDGSVAKGQGLRFVFTDHSRLVFRLSGTGSSGATIRLYAEQYEKDEAKQGADAQEALKPLIDLALKVSNLTEITGRSSPTVIT